MKTTQLVCAVAAAICCFATLSAPFANCETEVSKEVTDLVEQEFKEHMVAQNLSIGMSIFLNYISIPLGFLIMAINSMRKSGKTPTEKTMIKVLLGASAISGVIFAFITRLFVKRDRKRLAKASRINKSFYEMQYAPLMIVAAFFCSLVPSFRNDIPKYAANLMYELKTNGISFKNFGSANSIVGWAIFAFVGNYILYKLSGLAFGLSMNEGMNRHLAKVSKGLDIADFEDDVKI